MTLQMIRAELVKIGGRRGTFGSGAALPLLAAIAVLVVLVVLRSTGHEGYESGEEALDTFELIGFFAVIGISLIGAQEGAYDVQAGTFRYLLISGKSALELYLLRVVALLVTAAIVVVPPSALAIIASYALPDAPDHDPLEGSDVAVFAWAAFLVAVVYGLIAMSVGALLRSSGAGIAAALVLNLGGLQLLLLVERLSEDLAQAMLPEAVATLSGENAHDSLVLAAAAVAAWLLAFLALGAWRTRRAEY